MRKVFCFYCNILTCLLKNAYPKSNVHVLLQMLYILPYIVKFYGTHIETKIVLDNITINTTIINTYLLNIPSNRQCATGTLKLSEYLKLGSLSKGLEPHTDERLQCKCAGLPTCYY